MVSQALLNFMNLLHGWVRELRGRHHPPDRVRERRALAAAEQGEQVDAPHAALAPKMQELKEKYKDDPTRMNQEVMKLYKEYGVNPVGGCLPMMIQIPIFFGLFTMLGRRRSCGTRRSFG